MGASPQDGSEGLLTSSLKLRDFARRTVKVEVVDQHHLAAPLHVWVGGLLLPLRLPRAPGGRLLLGNADQHHLAVPTRFSCSTDEWFGDGLLVLAFGEVANGDTLGLRPAVNSRYVGFTDLAEGRRGRDPEATLSIQKQAHLADRLELGDIRLQKEAVDRTAAQRDVVVQQGGIIGHRVALLVWNARRLHRKRGPRLRSPYRGRATSAV